MNAEYWDPSGWEARAERAQAERDARHRYDDPPDTPPRSPEFKQCRKCGAWRTDPTCPCRQGGRA